ncbi:hypothetical protein [Burkholderia cenocepacia]|uniref:hypothetical protein n=1 Tax=Burkholderia cenocepacia TaxID=95486 RepID=UPI002DDC9780|nr:hypothetical protein [Burkholderia cenocepacia]MEC4775144.1 hypothetical protein [Burkholderia cenocepacia]
MFRILVAIPVVGFILRVANTYAYGGDYKAIAEFAGLRRWLKAYFFSVMLATVFAAITIWPALASIVQGNGFDLSRIGDFSSRPGALIVAINPCLLGFGIGVYALIFGLSDVFVRRFRNFLETKKKSGEIGHGSELVLNSDLAYPLIVLLVSIAIGVIQQANQSNKCLLVICWIAFWYSMIVMIEMIGVIFRLAENSLIDKGGAARNELNENHDIHDRN